MRINQSMRKSKTRYFYHIFVCPEDAPGAIMLWMEREFDAYKLSRYMCHLTISVSEISLERDICENIVILSYPLAFDAPVRGFPWEHRHPLWYGKTRMAWLPDGEKNSKICL